MPTFSRSVRVAAPIDRVWAVHDDLHGLDSLTPSVAGLRFESVIGPDGAPFPDALLLRPRSPSRSGRSAWAPTPVPGQNRRTRAHRGAGDSATSSSTAPSTGGSTHRFFADCDATIVSDTVRYGLPGLAGRVAGSLPGRVDRRFASRIEALLERSLDPLAARLAGLGLALAFAGRHRQTSRLLEDF